MESIMDNKLTTMGVSSEVEFNTIMFEKRLTSLKDSQESINSCCHWCLNNKQHHKKIVNCWLNVLKRVKVEHRLTLFYLANDVIQYSKRRNYDFVESWGTSLQKATTLVRDEKVKHKILRIFKIWEQRGIYGEEFLADLCGLISASPSARKGDETHEFQSSYLIQKIRTCSRLEADTDIKLKQLKEHNPKIQIDSESLISSLKDRAHVDDVEKEIDDYSKQMEDYINALKMEIKSRINLISLLTQAETQLGNDKKDVKVVTTAYKTFSSRVKEFKKKLDEKLPTLTSPVPSPDINAPSPSPDSDIELPNNDNTTNTPASPVTCTANIINNSAGLYTNAGYYNPVPPPTPDSGNSGFGSNSFSSFIGSNMSFNLQNFNSSSLFGSDSSTQNQNPPPPTNTTSQTQTTNTYNVNDAISSLFPSMVCPPPPPAPNIPNSAPPSTNEYQYGNSTHVPLMPPPMPPFSKADDTYGISSYGDNTYNGNTNANYVNAPYEPTPPPYQSNTPSYQPAATSYEPSHQVYPTPAPTLQPPPPTTSFEPFNPDYAAYQNPEPPLTNYPPPSVPISNPYSTADEYNPEEEIEKWDTEATWEQPPPVDLDTPESPPLFEKEGYGDPIEYHDANVFSGAEDVDHRVLPSIITDSVNTEEKIGHRSKDVDHRNLISLTGSPNETRSVWKMPQSDQDYRKSVNSEQCNVGDKDYRVPPFNIENFKLPPPPPPPKMLTNQGLDCPIPFNPNMKLEEFSKEHFDMAKPPPPIPMKRPGVSPRKLQDNNESIDMDLSDDDHDMNVTNEEIIRNDSSANTTNPTSPSSEGFDLPPPPFPDLMDDLDANEFLDNVNENLDLGEFDTDLESIDQSQLKPGLLGSGPTPPFQMNFPNPQNPIFNDCSSPTSELGQNWMGQQPPPQEFINNQEFQNRDFSFRGRVIYLHHQQIFIQLLVGISFTITVYLSGSRDLELVHNVVAKPQTKLYTRYT
ncbi:hypothetical protein ILUMI_26396 [Ignelater luminosus]|uniref:Regulation of nuclear pre-mRNA domain-containing protein 2 n=1 Tax=Ignelater luminosus TaxID=2038154 RepID=A0A8K0C3T9_IGNLU|nr:hypothetical protein ILUMI_26396 [Ignelater luminosus]